MEELREMLKAITRAANAFADSFGPGSEGAPGLAAPAAAPRKRRTKAEIAAAIPAPALPAPAADPADPLAGLNQPVAPAPAAEAPNPEEQSTKEMYATAKAYVLRFQQSKPDGTAKAKAILASKFGGKGLTLLTHADRIGFVSTLKAEILAADKGA